ncbi:MAG: glucose-6-phosphate isomerase [Bacteroidales bacterium]|jgi:glucose-6-phosphate isomerase|nr:glucose-6-phosphate isomerase [Bacteroidales bacterium]
MITTKYRADSALLPFFTYYSEAVQQAYQQIITKTGKGHEFSGWLDLPETISVQLSEIEHAAKKLKQQSETVIVIGIGGSYLGARAVIEALQNPFASMANDPANFNPDILYAGHTLSEDYLYNLLQIIDNKEYSLIVISKSGTTTEPAIAFRVLREHCERKYGKTNARERIVAITDGNRGALKMMAQEEGYCTFVIPDDVGGRYSVLTPAGLLPIAVAGFDMAHLIAGAQAMRQHVLSTGNILQNCALQYALCRYLLYGQHKKIELMAAYEPALYYFIEWYKQLFGESEGKENRGIFPAGAIFSTDLHSLGQYIQEGERHLFETVISVEKVHHHVSIPYDAQNLDGLNYLQKRSLNEINRIAEEGTRMAHLSGGVPNLTVTIPEINENSLGELIFFFEFSCAISGSLLKINPFDQPGVEAYKKNMFRLLGKEG